MIIRSLLDNDLYKFTMQQAVFHHFPGTSAQYHFVCRTDNVDFLSLLESIKKALADFCQLTFQANELDYLAELPYIKKDYIDALRSYQPDANYIYLSFDKNNHNKLLPLQAILEENYSNKRQWPLPVQTKKTDQFRLVIEGPWFHTILFEVPFLAILNEVYYQQKIDASFNYTIAKNNLYDKIRCIQSSSLSSYFRFSDFGTRRRFNFTWQKTLVETLVNELSHNFVGTSNVLLAKEYNIHPIGTMAHEFLQACQVLAPSLRESQRYALEVWLKEYNGQLAIALTDVYNLKSFLRDFDKDLATAYQGVRNDSGDPFKWGDGILAHYEKLNINPLEKTLVFSNSLTVKKALKICDYFIQRSNTSFGIGTHLTNDVGFPPLDIVIKMTECNGYPVAKLTDSPGKAVCTDEAFLWKVKQLFG